MAKQLFKIHSDQGIIDYRYDGDLYSLGTKLTELKATKLVIPNNIPKYSFTQIKKNTKSMKQLTVELSNDLSWNKGTFGNSGESYSDKYAKLFTEDFVNSDEFTELMLNVDTARDIVKKINDIVSRNIVNGKHLAHYYVSWK